MISNGYSLLFGGLLACYALGNLFINNLHWLLLLDSNIILVDIKNIDAASASTTRIRGAGGSRGTGR